MSPKTILLVLCFVGNWALTDPIAAADEPVRIRGGHGAGVAVVKAQAQLFMDLQRRADTSLLDVRPWTDDKNIEQYAEGKCHILVHRRLPTAAEKEFLVQEFPADGAQPEVFLVGYFRVAVVVHNENPIRSLSVDQIHKLLCRGSTSIQWGDLGGVGAVVNCYAEEGEGPTDMVLRHKCMMLGPEYPTGYYQFRKDIERCKSPEAVLQRIQADRNGIGFLLYSGQPLKGVRLLAVKETADSEAIAMETGPYCEKGYLLQEPVLLYLHPKAPSVARAFCEFAVGSAGMAVAEKFGLTTSQAKYEAEGKARLAESKSGKGPRVFWVGTVGRRSGQEFVTTLSAEYVRARSVVQVEYASASSDVAALGVFLGAGGGTRPGRELLLLAGHLGERAMQVHGAKWGELNPTEYLIAGRGVGVIVNPANQLSSLTLDQVRGIFAGDVADWSVIGGTGLGGAGRPGAATGKAAVEIHGYGLPQGEAAAGVFGKECLATDKWRRVTVKKTSAEVIQAVASDPAAVGFVDLSSLGPLGLGGQPADGTVKVLAIGAGAQAVAATPDNLKNAMYPLSERTYLYVHPQASETAKDFAQFVATCGASAATPYADTVQAVLEAYRQQGLIPLGEAALERMAKDALKAATSPAAAP